MLRLAIALIVPLVAIMLFLRDLTPRGWPAWDVAGAIVVGVAGAIMAFRRDGLARSMLWLVSLATVLMLVVYDLLDALIDPFIEADWPVAVIAVLLVVTIGTVLDVLIWDED